MGGVGQARQCSMLLPLSGGKDTSRTNAQREQSAKRIHDHFFRQGGPVYPAFVEWFDDARADCRSAIEAEGERRGEGIRLVERCLAGAMLRVASHVA